MIRLALAFTFLAGAVQAGPWEEFERRCLVPMENFEQVDIAELRFLGKQEGPEMLSVYLPSSQGFLFLHSSTNDAADLGCSVIIGENASQTVQNTFFRKFTAWSQRVLSEETYEHVSGALEDEDPHFTVVSNLFREPVLSVSLWKQMETGAWTVAVQETDLES